MNGPLRVRALALHAEYGCGRSGVCCTSGWVIPVEPGTEHRLRTALAGGELRVAVRDGERRSRSAVDGLRVPRSLGAEDAMRSAAGLPHGARALLRCDAHGRCIFFEAGAVTSCAVHAQLGEDALPSACRHFPRVTRITPRGVDVTLSHYCPTAAGLLFRDLPLRGQADPLLRIVLRPRAFPDGWPYEGLDAREAFPPLLRPGTLFGWQAYERWEADAVAVLAEAGSPEAALESLAAMAERIRTWNPREGDFETFFEAELLRPREERSPASLTAEAALDARDEVAASIPRAHATQRGARGRATDRQRPPGEGGRLVAAGWPQLDAPIRRWLAAKVFGSWLALQGEGVRTTVLGLRVALGVLRTEAARGCAEAGRILDAELLREAVRRADLLLVHLADPAALARRLSRCERPGAPACPVRPHARIGGPT